MSALPLRFYIIMALLLLMGFLFCVINIPIAYQILRPELICLIVIYWSINLPQRFGICFAFFVGLAQDMIERTVWGAHALALTVVAYCCVCAYQRIRSYSIWHQTLWILILVGTHQIIVNWVQGLAGYHAPVFNLLTSIIITAFMWPVVAWSLRHVRRRYQLF